MKTNTNINTNSNVIANTTGNQNRNINTNSNRRKFLTFGAGATGVLLASNPIAKAFAGACGLTPAQTPGPFYPGEGLFHPESDLTQIQGRLLGAKGQVIYVKGRVVDPSCRPIPRAAVEIWQACASGKYNNPNDDNPAPLDPNFKYWGETFTNEQGEYVFKTIQPGAYPADTNWIRPPHIHFKISCLGYNELITQLYFKGNPLNDLDHIYNKIPVGERGNVTIDFQPASAEYEAGSLVGNFEITLQSVR